MGALRRRIPYPARLMAYAALLAGAATVLAVLSATLHNRSQPRIAPNQRSDRRQSRRRGQHTDRPVLFWLACGL